MQAIFQSYGVKKKNPGYWPGFSFVFLVGLN